MLQIDSSGLVTSVGLSTATAAAAIRAGLSNPQFTRFIDWGGEWITAHVVPMHASNPRTKLLQMAASAINECLASVERESIKGAALVLCLPEVSRPSTGDELGEFAIKDIAATLGVEFSTHSSTISAGRVGGFVGLQRARTLLYEGKADAVIVIGVDSYVNWPALSNFENRHRLLTSRNSNGFLPGEAAAAVIVSRPKPGVALRCEGLGFASESATIDADLPLRADGLVEAIRAAARDADCRPQDFELRISALSGEHYYFKEAALAVSRLIRDPRSEAELWHPADCVGEVGAAAGPLAVVIAAVACAKGYSGASRILCHLSSDGTERAAAFFCYGTLQ
ncbi:beta-ketoacyl synthase N-terminal-like domain-containing protein [Nitrosospira briensis]|nr:beta-ketoacyl synthase N-terminal-like domain-containing protein [Nitrosospira briensis]